MIHREVGVKTVFSSWSCESSQVNLLQKSLLSQHEEHGRIAALEQQVSLYDKPLFFLFFFFVIWRVSTVCVLLYNNIYNIANPLDSFFFCCSFTFTFSPKIQLSAKEFESEKIDRMQHQLHKVLKELRKARDQIEKLESAVSVSVFYFDLAGMLRPLQHLPGFWTKCCDLSFRSRPTPAFQSRATTTGSS